MLNVTKELTALARKLGYTGKAPDTVAKAINAITASVGEGGGGECIDVELSRTEIDSATYRLYFDKTAETISTAYSAGIPIHVHLREEGDDVVADIAGQASGETKAGEKFYVFTISWPIFGGTGIRTDDVLADENPYFEFVMGS